MLSTLLLPHFPHYSTPPSLPTVYTPSPPLPSLQHSVPSTLLLPHFPHYSTPPSLPSVHTRYWVLSSLISLSTALSVSTLLFPHFHQYSTPPSVLSTLSFSLTSLSTALGVEYSLLLPHFPQYSTLSSGVKCMLYLSYCSSVSGVWVYMQSCHIAPL